MSGNAIPPNTAEVTAEIVSAYVANNRVAPSELAELITSVAGQLSKLGAESKQPAEEKSAPAVSLRRSVRPDHLVCVVCGKPQKVLKRHLAVQHDLTPAQYRERFGLKPDYPMVAPNYAQQRRREVALKLGLGKPKKQARRAPKSTARSKARKSAQSATTEAGS